MDIKRKDLFCTDCMTPSSRGFKKVISLKNSGLLIYLHTGEESKNQSALEEMKKQAVDKTKQLGIFILHNDSEHDLRRPDYAIEMCQLRTRCFRCINIVKRLRSLLGELNFIRQNQVIGICEHCKRNPGTCKRCQYIVKKFLDNKSELHVEKQDQFKSWLSKLNQFLHYVLNDENCPCPGQINSDPSALELGILLHELKRPLQLKRLHSTTFSSTDLAQLSSMKAGNVMIDELMAKIKPEDLKKPALDEDIPPVDDGTQLLPKEDQITRPRHLTPLTSLKKPALDEDIPPLDDGTQLLSKEYQKTRPRRLTPLTRTMQNKRLHELNGKQNVSENQSEVEQNNVKEHHRRGKGTKKEKHKSVSEITNKGSTSNILEKSNASKTQFKDNLRDVTVSHRKKSIKKDKNKAISEMSKDTTLKLLEKYEVMKNKSNKSDKKSNDTVTHTKKSIKIDENKAISKRSKRLTEGSTSKPLRKKLNSGDGKENKNSEAIQAKEGKHEKEVKTSVKGKYFSFSGMSNAKSIKFYNQTGKKRGKENKNNQNTPNPYANTKIPSVKIIDDDHLFSIDSFVECDQENPDLITEMIKRTKLVKYDPQYKQNLLISSEMEEDKMEEDKMEEDKTEEHKTEEDSILPDLFQKTGKTKTNSSAGILKYQLSDKTFISNGYTILPVIKVMKRVNLYKMEPANPQFNWFKRHTDVRTKNYETGEILAEIKEDGTGRWFYKNGRIALDCYKAQDVIAGRRYVLYSSGEESTQDQRARLKELEHTPHVLGVFDFLGNGAIYDLHGNERIKYNQTEGIIFDRKIAPEGHWKWHSLNDPPVLDTVLIDNYDPSFSIANHNEIDHTEKLNKRHQNPEVLQAELQSFAKQKAKTMLRKYKPFPIRMKAFKVNDEFSLSILDQANIYLRFRHGAISMKLNLGLRLVSNEIVDTDTCSVGEVATPVDQIPPRTDSIANIQYNLHSARKLHSEAKARETPSTYLPLSKHNGLSRSSI